MNEWRKEALEVHLSDTVFLGWRFRERAIPETVSDLSRSPVAPKVPPEGGARLRKACVSGFSSQRQKLVLATKRSRDGPTQLSLNTYKTKATKAK